ncbi:MULTISPECIES: small acid-soluble spore protein SspI [Anoxybacillus]|uniref:Small, acid-soluble spore protein I n=1 Tax=Anoxybacillus flavithermus TaxID=33934 RepID=A0A178TS28_9BACL|nr:MULTISPECIES: small acid-soluble spore protein SspI [Anoxybacillus]QAV27477.1 small acid-soluble spore protein SspI [Neobacillus thermocopriae]ASA97724.1 small acid-soluble spore protein SspI [Anoxybacillus flavithermus]MBE2908154.1 small acid-soluble spore protein SspI [Anoxybacillus flavithermus]MBE2911119.1 small acid-soluble spore protein SspI [Anoxybacillus flavithermus]MBE2912014.1 small acid-soluble spore protein SspI [Anoxybacillus flavithermus]
MDFNLRGAVMANVANSSKDQLQHTIVDAIQQGEEKYLPGLGVLFEALWNHATEEQKQSMLETLEKAVKK